MARRGDGLFSAPGWGLRVVMAGGDATAAAGGGEGEGDGVGLGKNLKPKLGGVWACGTLGRGAGAGAGVGVGSWVGDCGGGAGNCGEAVFRIA